MAITVSDLYIGGVKMPTPALEGLTIKREKIWSADTGRTASGKMVGTKIATKTTISIKWPPLSMGDVAKIETATDGEFTTLKYTDMTGTTKTLTGYFGTPSYTIYSYSPGVQYVKDVTVDFIEQ